MSKARRVAIPLLLAAAAAAARVAAQPFDPSSYSGMRWRMAGPFRGGRALAVALVPGQPNHFYFGAVGGGVWETHNAGRTWEPIFDGEPVASIGAIAVAPSDPRVVYVGTGEADMRSDISYGNGMYRSSDGGKTWSRIGLEATRQIARIVVGFEGSIARSTAPVSSLRKSTRAHVRPPSIERYTPRSAFGP